MERVIETARQAGLLFVEDCAQAWCGPEYRGHPEADASFFSFGTIKTGTALGGAMLRVSRPDLLAEMRRREAEYPAQSQAAYTRQVTRTGVLKLISSRIGFGLLTWLAKLRGLGVDELLNRLTKGFPLRELFPQIRQRPCPALLRLLHRRLTKYDGRSVERRVANARLLMERSGFQPVELLEESHTFWLFPFQTDRPREFIDRLRELGIDATQYGRLEVVEAPPERPGLRCETARAMLDRTVFVPCYAGLPEAVLDKAARLMSEFQLMDTAEATASASASERQPIAK